MVVHNMDPVGAIVRPLQTAFRQPGQTFRAFIAEFLAMTMFVFLGCGSVAATGEFLVDEAGASVKASVARVLPIATTFGLAITVLAFGVGPISGGHINPAVTFALFLMGRISWFTTLIYWAAQFGGSVFGALLLWAGLSNSSYQLSPGTTIPNFRPGVDIVPAVGRPPFQLGANQLNPVLNTGNGLVLEIMGTSLLIGTVLMTAVDGRSMGNVGALAPLPIGISVWIVHLVLIPWTGCGINPARTFGPAIVNSFAANDTWEGWWWIYYVGPAFGAIFTCMITCLLWGGRYPPGHALKVEDENKVDLEEQETLNSKPGKKEAKPDVDLDAITI